MAPLSTTRSAHLGCVLVVFLLWLVGLTRVLGGGSVRFGFAMCCAPNQSSPHWQGSESEDNIESGWMQLNFDAKLVSGEIVALPRKLGLALTDFLSDSCAM